MKIKTVAVLGAGAVGSYVIWGLSRREGYPAGEFLQRVSVRRIEKRLHDQ